MILKSTVQDTVDYKGEIMNDKLTPKMIRKAVKILEKHKVTKPYYIDVEKPSEVYDFLSNYNKNKKMTNKIKVKSTIL